ncbi:hypothetical protein BSL78_09440 [Apostichopus japonicus]|uniref:Uncharacterized protein n=1 Tax=Stichopus japonicus TaxID=307972 RepID=A0A2G8L084_STIJA|nr:hypothetical protein BSL78_09440 [Apostichopus japonicus]
MKDENVTNFELLEHEHKVLDKIAFEALSGNDQKLVWNREQLCNQLGHEFYDQYLRIGIFVEEEVLNIADTSNAQDHIQYNTEVHFYHKIFCEWYAVHYIAEQLPGRNTDCIDEFLQTLDPFDLQYVYRFACGLNNIAGEKIIQYLQQKNESRKFANLCMLEQEEKTDRFLNSVSDVVSTELTCIREGDSKLLQRSTLQILNVASKNQIPIYHVYLRWSFSGFDGQDIRLESGLCLSSLSSVEKISINAKGKGNTLSEEEVIGLINYGIKSKRFKALWLDNCKLPSSIRPDIIPEESRSNNIKVISSGEACYLDLQSGNWSKPDDIQTIAEICSGDLSIHRDTSESVQRSVIELLVKASNHDIGYTLKHAGLFQRRYPSAATTLMTTILGPLYREIHWSSTKFLAIPETAVTFFPAMLQNRRRTSSHNRVKHKSNFSPTKYYQSQSKISFIATNSWRNELPQRRQKFFTFSEITLENCSFTAKSSSNF